MKVKMFFGKAGYFSSDKLSSDIEEGINSWLSRNPGLKVVHVLQSQSGGSLEPASAVVSVWYED